jgi:hypothetical protein
MRLRVREVRVADLVVDSGRHVPWIFHEVPCIFHTCGPHVVRVGVAC